MDAAVNQLRESIEIRNMHGAQSPTSLEWWYFTGHLWNNETMAPCADTVDVKEFFRKSEPRYAVQSTFFLADKNDPKGLLAHAAEADLNLKKHNSSERFAVFSKDAMSNPLAFALPGFLNLTLGNWRLVQLAAEKSRLHWDLRFDVKGAEYLLHLTFKPKDIWLHGDRGYLKKTADSGNFYYSVPNVTASGARLTRSENGKILQENVCGQLWLDHEIHVTKVMDVGWRWFGLTFANDKALMLYQISRGGQFLEAQGEMWDQATKKATQLSKVAITAESERCLQSKRCYPQSFKVEFLDPNTGLMNKVKTAARFADQEMGTVSNGLGRPYWEGSAKATWEVQSSRPENKPQVADGQGFIELVPQEPKKEDRKDPGK